jgi:hypothetical protein
MMQPARRLGTTTALHTLPVIQTIGGGPDQHGQGYWPIAKREETVACFVEAYQSRGFEVCEPELEPEFERIVIYTLNGIPTHAARQIENGKWVSKLGPWEDIEHNTAKAVEEYIYGKATAYMKKKRNP